MVTASKAETLWHITVAVLVNRYMLKHGKITHTDTHTNTQTHRHTHTHTHIYIHTQTHTHWDGSKEITHIHKTGQTGSDYKRRASTQERPQVQPNTTELC